MKNETKTESKERKCKPGHRYIWCSVTVISKVVLENEVFRGEDRTPDMYMFLTFEELHNLSLEVPAFLKRSVAGYISSKTVRHESKMKDWSENGLCRLSNDGS